MFAKIRHDNGHWTVNINGQQYYVHTDNDKYDALVECINAQDEEEFENVFNSDCDALSKWVGSDGDFTFDRGVITYQGNEIHRVITDRIFRHMEQGVDHKYLLMFLENLYKNPSYRAIQELYTFMEHKHLPISDDGCLIAYKYVSIYNGEDITDKNGNTLTNGDRVDSHTGKTHRNNVGDVVFMPRHQVDDNFNNGCSRGLHIGSWEYSGSGNGNSVVVKVNPADVVSIPNDCSCQKMRCCRYEVVKVLGDKPYESEVINNDNYDDEYIDHEDEYYEEDEFYDQF